MIDPGGVPVCKTMSVADLLLTSFHEIDIIKMIYVITYAKYGPTVHVGTYVRT